MTEIPDRQRCNSIIKKGLQRLDEQLNFKPSDDWSQQMESMMIHATTDAIRVAIEVKKNQHG